MVVAAAVATTTETAVDMESTAMLAQRFDATKSNIGTTLMIVEGARKALESAKTIADETVGLKKGKLADKNISEDDRIAAYILLQKHEKTLHNAKMSLLEAKKALEAQPTELDDMPVEPVVEPVALVEVAQEVDTVEEPVAVVKTGGKMVNRGNKVNRNKKSGKNHGKHSGKQFGRKLNKKQKSKLASSLSSFH